MPRARQENGEVMESSAWRDESWGDCERWPVTVLTWRAAEDCSRYEGRRPEKLGHRRFTAAYGGQSATMPRRNAYDIELRCLLAGRVRRRGTAVLHLADTCRQKSQLVVDPLRRLQPRSLATARFDRPHIINTPLLRSQFRPSVCL